ncbi:MAG: RsmE family RNA methyltransferase [bacterium]
MNLIILQKEDRIDDFLYRIKDNRARHILEILKLDTGDTVEAGILNGPQGKAIIESVSGNTLILKCSDFTMMPAPAITIDLICAMPRPQTLRRVLRTIATMGVRKLFLIRANRVEKSYFHSPLLEPDNYTPYLIEGLAQGKLTRLPEVTIHKRFKPFFEDTLKDNAKDETGDALRLLADTETKRLLSKIYSDPRRVLLAIGPEGGWVPFEVALMKEIGFESFTLGQWLLRVESAVTAALAQIELLGRDST